MKGRNEDKRPIYLSTSCCFQKLDEMEKNGNYGPAKEEENDAARQADRKLDAAGPHCDISKYLTIQSQHKPRDPFVYLFINEGDETG